MGLRNHADLDVIERDVDRPSPLCMVYLSLALPAKVNRYTNIVLSAIYIIIAFGTAVGEIQAYYIFGSAGEVVPSLSQIVWFAWKWPGSQGLFRLGLEKRWILKVRIRVINEGHSSNWKRTRGSEARGDGKVHAPGNERDAGPSSRLDDRHIRRRRG